MTDLDHPCRNTCSGWAMAYNKGYSEAQKETEEKAKKLESAIKLINDIAMMGCSGNAYTKEFTEYVNSKCRKWLQDHADENDTPEPSQNKNK